ncbi:hypothetical protein [Cohnella faecalis]|nr:hypothetical protein [Cohnella faecalis]
MESLPFAAACDRAEKGEIAAFIVWDPAAQQAIDDKKYVRLLSNGHDEPFKSGYCCYLRHQRQSGGGRCADLKRLNRGRCLAGAHDFLSSIALLSGRDPNDERGDLAFLRRRSQAAAKG